MCNYTQREYSCGHFRWVASRWCLEYSLTHKRCKPNVTHFEFRDDSICGECRPQWQWGPCPWESMIKRVTQKHTA
ncbi:hypothetical protein QBC34DRAFT_59683 [Podospora aff. communis PSN243]|uniref:Uncharacterized protein n=1 Tax=Podospora aff. communis PSN243 TaxID=3040156 RepID=A0AAV9GXL6_9PEZI|nr:hypothetical protein QBC34DRAFT_59683 [Podospora aff. communis PSN243]